MGLLGLAMRLSRQGQIRDMNCALCSTRPMCIGSVATKKHIGGGKNYEKSM